MAGSRYPQRVDLENWNTSQALAVMSVLPGSRVLDLGTADGSIARALKDRGCTVWGIECDKQAADAASQVCDRVIVADLETPEAFDTLDGETFDVVLALDVLEHLRDPTPVLRRAATHLTAKGVAIVSIPNVAHGALRVSLLEGRFNYTEQGLLDRTHLRFFDRRSAERLMGEAGLTIEQNLRVRRELDETEIAVSREGLSPELLNSLARDPDATTYQFVFVAGRKDRLATSPPGGMLSERLIAENDSLLGQYRELQAYVKSLEADRVARMEVTGRELQLQRERDELRQELERRTEEAHRLHMDFKQSKAEVVLKDTYISELRQQVDLLSAEVRQLSKKRKDLSASPDRLTAEREQLLARQDSLETTVRELRARRDQLAAEREQLLARQDGLETTVRELRAYANSAGFRIVEALIRRLRSFPAVFKTARAMARRIARRVATVD